MLPTQEKSRLGLVSSWIVGVVSKIRRYLRDTDLATAQNQSRKTGHQDRGDGGPCPVLDFLQSTVRFVFNEVAGKIMSTALISLAAFDTTPDVPQP